MNRARLLFTALLLLLLAYLAGTASAGSTDGPAVDWSVMSGGGAPAASSSGSVGLNGSLGQTAIGPSAGGDLGLGAGYWYGLGERGYELYLPLVLRND